MPVKNAVPTFSGNPWRDTGEAWFFGTVSSGVVTKVSGDCTCGDFSTGVADVTFQTCKLAAPICANEDTGSATAGNNHSLRIDTIDAGAGTAKLRCQAKDNGDLESPADGTISFCIKLGW